VTSLNSRSWGQISRRSTNVKASDIQLANVVKAEAVRKEVYFMSGCEREDLYHSRKEICTRKGLSKTYQLMTAEAQQLYDVSTTKNGSGGTISAAVFRCQHRMS